MAQDGDGNSGANRFRDLLKLAEDDLWSDFKKAIELQHSGDMGSARERALAAFLGQRLPSRYRVVSGHIMDAQGRQSGQTDLVIYDASETRPLLQQQGGSALLAAEAVLATVEVKSTLTEAEVVKSIKGISELHRLRPWKQAWQADRVRGASADDGQPRLLCSIFAYQTSLSMDNWSMKESDRLRRCAKEHGCDLSQINRLAVLSRGLLLPSRDRVAQPGDDRGVLGLWFFSLVNFLAREVRRRKPFPWDSYEFRKDPWSAIPMPPSGAHSPRRVRRRRNA